MLAHHSQQATPPSEGSKPLPITRNANSQTTPHHSSKEDDLARRCRQLARSVGHGAVVETQFGSTTSNTGRDSPSPVRASPSGSPARSPRISGSSLFPLSPTGKPLPPPISPRSSYPTPEGSFTLNEIQEEPSGGDALASIANDASNRPSLSAVISSGALSTDEEDLPIGRVKTSRTSSRMTALNSLKLSGENLDEALLRSSLRDGVSHFEVDLWLADGELLVGPDEKTVSPENTISSMYIDPLLTIFQPPQPPTPSTNGSFSHHRRRSSASSTNHPFPAYAQLPLLLLMNLRSSPSTALQYLLHFVEPLHDAGLLTSYCANSGMLTLGLMTIIVEGVDQATRDEINGMSPRFVFAEGAVVHAHEEDERMDSAREICPVAVGELEEAVGWKGEEELSEALKLGVRDQVEHAHAKGLKVFYRVGKDRELTAQVKEDLRAEGVDYL